MEAEHQFCPFIFFFSIAYNTVWTVTPAIIIDRQKKEIIYKNQEAFTQKMNKQLNINSLEKTC